MDLILYVLAGPWALRLVVTLIFLPLIIILDVMAMIASDKRLRFLLFFACVWMSGVWAAAWLLS